MPNLFSFIVTSLDGFDEGPEGSFDWPAVDDEFIEFSNSQLRDIGVLVFGRKTYEVMAAFWPTDLARDFPETADFMNALPKVVFSSSLSSADWNNTTLASGDLVREIGELKGKPGKDIAVFGSAHLTAELIAAGLVDELRILVAPVLVNKGRSLLGALSSRVNLELLRTTTFKSGNVLLCYRPIPTSET